MDKKGIFVIVLLALFLTAFVLFSGRGKEGSGGMGFPTTHSAGSRGLKAFYLILKKEGYPVRRLMEGWERLKGEGNILILAGPFRRESEWREGIHLRSWIKKGNTLIWFAGFGDDVTTLDFLEPRLKQVLKLRIRSREGSGFAPEQIIKTRGRGLVRRPTSIGYSRGISRVAVGSSRGYDVYDEDALPVYGWMEGHAVYKKRFGRGAIFLFPSSQFVDNGMIGEGDNLFLVLNVIRNHLEGEAIHIDEYHHGFSKVSVARLFKGRAVRYGAFQLLIVIVLHVFSRIRRFGEPVGLEEGEDRRFKEFILAMGNLYRKGKKGAYVLDRDFRFFRKRIAAAPGFSHSLSDEELVKKLDGERPPGKEGWGRWYEEFRKVRGAALLSDQSTLRLSRELARTEKEVFQ